MIITSAKKILFYQKCIFLLKQPIFTEYGGAAFWIGLKDEKWLTGEHFVNIYDAHVRLNNHDSGYPEDTESNCGRFSAKPVLIDNSCNIRKRYSFICEIFMS